MDKPLVRSDIPIFYTLKAPSKHHKDEFGRVFAESSDHTDKQWISVGYVSKNSPFGQGTFLGFPRSELREATQEEVLIALRQNHPHGWGFRPRCKEAADASFNLAMSCAVRNWTNDDTGGSAPILNVSRQEIKKAGDDAYKKHRRLMILWPIICWRQRKMIKEKFKVFAERSKS